MIKDESAESKIQEYKAPDDKYGSAESSEIEAKTADHGKSENAAMRTKVASNEAAARRPFHQEQAATPQQPAYHEPAPQRIVSEQPVYRADGTVVVSGG